MYGTALIEQALGLPTRIVLGRARIADRKARFNRRSVTQTRRSLRFQVHATRLMAHGFRKVVPQLAPDLETAECQGHPVKTRPAW
jgi:hypothetical protein